jgi:DNA mismatch repair protein MutL
MLWKLMARSSSGLASKSKDSAAGLWWCTQCHFRTRHPRFEAETCFREMVADLARGRFGGWTNRLQRFAATYACRAAVKAGERLEEREMRELLLRLFATDLPPHDVHGRATIVQLPREELERRFGRR